MNESEFKRVYIGTSLDDMLRVYDSDTTDKTLHINGDQLNMDGKWYRQKQDGITVYYFEEDKE